MATEGSSHPLGHETSTRALGPHEYEVTIVKYGTRQTTKSDVYLNYDVYQDADGPIGMDYFFWIISNDSRTVLVDTGFSRASGRARNRKFLLDPARAYELCGVDPASAPIVIVTHAHYDHIGNLDLFPASPVVISRSEFDFWRGPYGQRTQFHFLVEDDDLRQLGAAHSDGRLTTFAGHLDLAPGIEVIELGGHTAGQSVVRVQTCAGPVLLASDAIHYYEEYERDRPFAFVADLAGTYKGYDSIRAMEADGSVQHVVSGHDPDTMARFAPVGGELAGLAASIGRRQ